MVYIRARRPLLGACTLWLPDQSSVLHSVYKRCSTAPSCHSPYVLPRMMHEGHALRCRRHCIQNLACLPAAQASRERILAAEPDPSEMHSLLNNLPPLGALSADELAQSAVAIYRRCPPKQLLRANSSNRLVTCALPCLPYAWGLAQV